jgi:hypothetical protein
MRSTLDPEVLTHQGLTQKLGQNLFVLDQDLESLEQQQRKRIAFNFQELVNGIGDRRNENSIFPVWLGTVIAVCEVRWFRGLHCFR